MLLVDNGQSEAMELHGVFDEGMGPHNNMDASVVQSTQYLGAAFPLDDACEQFHADRHVAKEVANRLQMLLGQYLCGGHQACLIAVVESNEHRHKCNESLA